MGETVIITVTYLDGTTEEFESDNPKFDAGLFQIENDSENKSLYIPLTSIKNVKTRLK